MTRVKRIITILVLVLIMVSLMTVTTYADETYYKPVTVHIEVVGNGTFTMTRTNAPEDMLEPDRNLEVRGKGTFELQYAEPGDYMYLVYSKNPQETQRWNVFISVTVDHEDNTLYTSTSYVDSVTGGKGEKLIFTATMTPESTETPTRPPKGGYTDTGDSTGINTYRLLMGSAVTLAVACCVILVVFRKKGAESHD